MADVRRDRNWPIQLKKELDKNIVGQNLYKETIAIGIYRQIKNGDVMPILVKGPTGSGKTFLFQCLKKSKLCPNKYTIMMTNISRLTEEGIKGPDLDDIFVEYAELCHAEHNSTYRGIIYMDEIDKLISPSFVSSGNGEVNKNATIQHQLMQIMDGGIIAGIPTENILFVFGGSFYQLDEYKKKEIKHGPIGFCTQELQYSPVLRNSTIREEMIKIGFQREFLGRIGQIIELEALTKNELRAVLMHPLKGVIPKMQKEYMSDGIELKVEKDAIEEILNAVISENLGARSARNIIEKILIGSWYRCIEGGYDKITIDLDTVRGGEVKYERRKKYPVQSIV